MPHLAHALELPDVEGVQTHELAGLAGSDMPRPAVLGLLEGSARPLGEQSGRLQGAVLQDGQPLPVCRQPRAPQGPLHRAGGHVRTRGYASSGPLVEAAMASCQRVSGTISRTLDTAV